MSNNNLNWIPQTSNNNESIQKTDKLKPKLTSTLKLKYISSKEDNFKRIMLYFRVVEPDNLNIVKQDIDNKKLTDVKLPFWYNTDDNEYIIKTASQNRKCHIHFEKDKVYDIDSEFKRYTTKQNHGYTFILHSVIEHQQDNNNDNASDND